MQPGNPAPTDLPAQIGPFRVLAQIGEGSFGVVYKAERREPVRQTVALKVLRAGVATKEVLARFELERKALAAMNHRCIAKVLDAGATDRGEPWAAMELVEGLPLTTYCDKHRLSLKERIVLFQQVCDGVQHAHQKGVVHRDLKPGNVFVVREGEQHVPKILDFGLAKATHRDVFGGGSFATQRDMALGTLEYMSPEQAAGDGEAIDARSDVYSLGVMLYELLCGELPFPSAMLKAAGEMEARRVVVEQEPKKPSTKLLSRQDSEVLAAQRRSSLGALKSALAGDLDWVVMKAMRKEPEGRYGAALALAADLGRYLAHEPLEAGPPSVGYRAKKFVRKYRGQLATGAAVLLTALVGTGIALQFAASESRARQREKLLAEKDRIYADLQRLQEARTREAGLWPAFPDRVPELEAWLADFADLAERLPIVEAELAAVRAKAKPSTDADRAARREAHPRQPELAKARATLAVSDDPSERSRSAATIEQLEEELEVADYEFDAPTDTENHRRVTRLARELRSFCEPGGTWIHGLAGVKARLAEARTIEQRSIRDHAAKWKEAIAAIEASDGVSASKLYAHFRLSEQMGLVPIGMDRESKLWEFIHLSSGTPGKEIPSVDPATGRIVPSKDMGIVFVLLPGGESWVGSQRVTPEDFLASLVRESDIAAGRASLELPELPLKWQDADAWTLHNHALNRVAPEQSGPVHRMRLICGEEALGLVAARVALTKNSVSRSEADHIMALSWALVANGQDVEAKMRASEALSKASTKHRARLENELNAVNAAIEHRAERIEAAKRSLSEMRPVEPRESHWGDLHQVDLEPYFLSKYEMTQGQWIRLRGKNPSWDAGMGDMLLPVDSVDWFDSEEAMASQGLRIPTGAQWEVGCRAGTATTWWFGNDAADYRGREHADTGFVEPVGSKAPNPFGLFDTLGNLKEWCRDSAFAESPPKGPEGRRGDDFDPYRSVRGGDFISGLPRDAATDRGAISGPSKGISIGIRPSRAVKL